MKKIILILIILLLIPFAGGESTFETMIGNGNLFYWKTEALWGDDFSQAAVTGWYPVEQWEWDTCIKTQTTTFEVNDQSSTGLLSSNAAIIDTTITLQGKQIDSPYEDYYENELGWYIHPFEETLKYGVEIKSNGVWIDLEGYTARSANPITGDAIYESWTGTENITYARLTASDGSYIEIPMVRT